jgi:hypothetical protein
VKIAQNNGDFTAKECQALMKYLFLKGNSVKKIVDRIIALSDKRRSYPSQELGC